MLDAICVRRTQSQGPPLDIGLLIEMLVFYQKAHIVCDVGTLEFLVSGPGPRFLLELVDRGVLSLSYLENIPGCLKSEKPGRGPRYDFALISSPKHALEERLPVIVRAAIADAGQAEKLTRRLFAIIKADKHHATIPDLARDDATDEHLLLRVVSALLHERAPGYVIPSPLVFKLKKEHELFSIETNLDFVAINASIGCCNPPWSISPESLLLSLPDVNSDLHFAAKLKADLLTLPVNNAVASLKVGEIFSKLTAGQQSICAFQDAIFEDGRSVREAVNSGERTLEDSLALIDASARFKHWVKGKDLSADLLKEYVRELSHLEWSEKLPMKMVRWALFTAIGMVTAPLNPAIGVGASLGDTFLVDRLVKGWKPNQFVEGPLRKFRSAAGGDQNGLR